MTRTGSPIFFDDRAVAERGAAFPSFARAQSILNLGIFFSTEGNIQINLRSMVRSEGVPYVLVETNIDEGVLSAPPSKYLHGQTGLLNDRRLVNHKSGN